jgi:hypothetical protein
LSLLTAALEVLSPSLTLSLASLTGLAVVTAYVSLQWEYGVLDGFLYSGSVLQRVGATALVSLLLLRLHPTPEAHTPSYEFSTSFVGVAFGVICGVQVRRAWYPERIYDTFVFVTAAEGLDKTLVVRFLLGLLMLGVTKIVTKWILSIVLPLLYACCFPIRIRRLWQPPIVDVNNGASIRSRGLKQTLDGRDADVDATTRFFSYAAIGFTASALVMAF